MAVETVAVGGLVNIPLSRQLQYSGMVGNDFTITAGTLPTGVTMSLTGLFTGTPTATFSGYITVRGTLSIGGTADSDILVGITNVGVVPVEQTGAATNFRPLHTDVWNLGGILWQAGVVKVDAITDYWVLGFYKSTDNGINWFRKGWDDVNFPQTTASAGRFNFAVTYVASGGKFYVAYPDTVAGTLKIATFNPANSTWTLQASAGGPSLTNMIRCHFALMCANGTLHVYYRRNGASVFDGQLYVSTYTVAGGWAVLNKLLSDTSAHPSGTIFIVTNSCTTIPLSEIGAIEADGVVQVFYEEDIVYFAPPVYQKKLHWRRLSVDASTWSADYIQPETDPRTNTPVIQGSANFQKFVLIGRKIYSFFKYYNAAIAPDILPTIAIANLDSLTITFETIYTTAQHNVDEGIVFIDPVTPSRLYAIYVQFSNFFGDILFVQHNDLAGGGWTPTHLHSAVGGSFTPTKEVVYFGWAFSWPGELVDEAAGTNDPCEFAPIIYQRRPVFLGDGRMVCAISGENDSDGAAPFGDNERMFIVPLATGSVGSIITGNLTIMN